MPKFLIKIPEVSYVTVEVEADSVEQGLEDVYRGNVDYWIKDGPEFSHNLPPDYGTDGKWLVVSESGEDVEYVLIWKPGKGFVWIPDSEAKPGYGY